MEVKAARLGEAREGMRSILPLHPADGEKRAKHFLPVVHEPLFAFSGELEELLLHLARNIFHLKN